MASSAFTQKIDSIYFHLYTDSLKKGTHNYINVDGKLADGTWMPLTSEHLNFTTDYGRFEGNDLVLPDTPIQKQVTVKAVLKSDAALWREVTIPIKQTPDNEYLPSNEEVIKGIKKVKRKNKSKN